MATPDTYIIPTLRGIAALHGIEKHPEFDSAPKRTMPFDAEPGFHEPAGLWLYGNARLLMGKLAYIPGALGPPDQDPQELDEIEAQTEKLVLDGNVLVTGIHNAAHQRVGLVPLRWGAPRILVFSGGFEYHLGKDLKDEPFRAARLWRYQWDAHTDLAISRRSPKSLPTYALLNPTVDSMVQRIASADWPGLRWILDAITRVLA